MKLFIGYHKNNKFISNMILANIEGLSIKHGKYRGELYKLHQQQKNNSYIFMSEDLDKELLQFITEYSSKVKIFIYHNNITNKQLIEGIRSCYHIIKEAYAYQNVIVSPYLMNTSVFTKNRKEAQVVESVLCFLDSIDHTNSTLNSLLYPNSKHNIRIYGPNSPHYQNLGTVSEYDKNDLLNRYSGYLDIDGQYTQEAILCGCDIYSKDSIIEKRTINNTLSLNYESYESFLIQILT